MSVHYIIQKTLNTNECRKSFFVNYNTLLHVSTPLGHLQGETLPWRCTAPVNGAVPVNSTLSLNCIVQPSVTKGRFLPEDDPAGLKHVGVCYNWRKNLFVHSLVFKVFLFMYILCMMLFAQHLFFTSDFPVMLLTTSVYDLLLNINILKNFIWSFTLRSCVSLNS
jgi:hypothetical protein